MKYYDTVKRLFTRAVRHSVDSGGGEKWLEKEASAARITWQMVRQVSLQTYFCYYFWMFTICWCNHTLLFKWLRFAGRLFLDTPSVKKNSIFARLKCVSPSISELFECFRFDIISFISNSKLQVQSDNILHNRGRVVLSSSSSR